MKVQLECADDIWLQVSIPDTVNVDSFLEKVKQIEHVIARDRKPQSAPAPRSYEEPKKAPEDVDGRLDHLEQSTQKIIDLLDRINH